MHHVAIMKKSWGLIPKILSGEKTIESRWYQARRTPWGKICTGDTVYFKNSGERVIARATVVKVLQFEITNILDAKKIIEQYGKDICMINTDPAVWGRLPKYCILMFLEHPKKVQPFSIDKTSFGSAAAWLTVKNIKDIKLE